jgi:hypothetical protein
VLEFADSSDVADPRAVIYWLATYRRMISRRLDLRKLSSMAFIDE